MNDYELSVFFPAYNEEQNIEKTIRDATGVLKSLSLKNYEILIIDDGSRDRTAELSHELEKELSGVRLVEHKRNLGYGGALKTGFKEAKFPWVAFADSDGQFDFGEITKFLAKADEADLVLGYRIKRADSFLREVFTFGWKSLAFILLGLNVRDYSCGFKMIKKSVFEAVQPLEGEEKVTQIELLVKAKRQGFNFAEVGVHHYARKFGTPTGAKLSVVFKSVVDIFKLWRKLG